MLRGVCRLRPLAAALAALGLLPGCGCEGDEGPACGDGVRTAPEACDGADLGWNPCLAWGLGAGGATCRADCTLDLSACTQCGDGFRAATEDCDGADLGGQTCESLGLAGGALACADCAFDTSACLRCGDGVRIAPEACDGADLGGQTCTGLGFKSGTLGCGELCQLDTSGCVRFNPWALAFDGIDDVVDCGYMGLGLPALSHTWEAWIHFEPAAVSGAVFHKWTEASVGPKTMAVYYNVIPDLVERSWTPCYLAGPACGEISEVIYYWPGAWHHFAWAVNGDTSSGPPGTASEELTIFVDGLIALGPDPIAFQDDLYWLVDSAFPLLIGHNGCDQGECWPFLGEVDEIRLWSYYRTSADILADMTLQLTGSEPNLLAYFPFDEGTGQFTTEVVSGETCVFGNTSGPDPADAAWTSDTPF
jgi:hypothetical protein